MRVISILSLFIYLLFGCTDPNSSRDESQRNVSSEEWISLFNGKNLDGWTIKVAGQDLGENFKKTFLVEDSMIRVQYVNYDSFADAFGHMYYEKPFSHYHLKFDYRFTGEQIPGGASWNVRNSGVMLHSQSAASNEIGQDFPVSIELQLLGGLNQGERTTGNVCTPGTAVVMGDTVNYEHCINSSSETYHGDQWVNAEAIVFGGDSMIFVIEGDTVLRFAKPQIGGGFISEQYEGKDFDQFGVERDKSMWISKAGTILTEGYIALQAESHPIDFKNIQLLDLCGCMDPKATNYKDYFVKDNRSECMYK
jgi:hypothetical protein